MTVAQANAPTWPFVLVHPSVHLYHIAWWSRLVQHIADNTQNTTHTAGQHKCNNYTRTWHYTKLFVLRETPPNKIQRTFTIDMENKNPNYTSCFYPFLPLLLLLTLEGVVGCVGWWVACVVLSWSSFLPNSSKNASSSCNNSSFQRDRGGTQQTCIHHTTIET